MATTKVASVPGKVLENQLYIKDLAQELGVRETFNHLLKNVTLIWVVSWTYKNLVRVQYSQSPMHFCLQEDIGKSRHDTV